MTIGNKNNFSVISTKSQVSSYMLDVEKVCLYLTVTVQWRQEIRAGAMYHKLVLLRLGA